MRESLVVLRPVVRWLLRKGVNYVGLAAALKEVFVAEAREELARSGRKITDSAVSVLSGVHRKDLRSFAAREQAGMTVSSRGPTLASQLVTRWLTEADYADSMTEGLRSLPRHGPAPSFEALAREVSTDVHSRTLLDELIRLGVARLEGDRVFLSGDAFVPAQEYSEMAAMLSASTSDHLAAAVHNLTGEGPRFLEQSVFADGLSPQAVEELSQVARQLWAQSFQAMVAQARERAGGNDDSAGPGWRMRFGAYYYHEAATESDPVSDGGANEAKPR